MKTWLWALVLILGLSGLAEAGQTRVRQHQRKNGTIVQQHYRTTPDRSKNNNWSSKGNINPHTGKKGSRSAWPR